MKTRNLRRETLRKSMQLNRYPVSILLDGLHDPVNVGGILRICNAFTGNGVYYRGDQSKIRIGKAAVGTQHFETLAQVPDGQLESFLAGYDKVVAFDNNCSFRTQRLEEFEFLPEAKYLMVFGNESSGVSRQMLDRADAVVTISQKGAVGSLNVAIAAAIAMYEYNKQLLGAAKDFAHR